MSDLTPTPAESSSGPPGQVGPYRLKSQLGAGGMGEVYRAFDARLDRSVAIKRVRASFTREGRERERFWREAKSIARLRHPAIVEVFDIVEEHDGGWIVMELIEGVTLQEAVCQGPLPVDQALGLFLELAGALAEAHGHGILHRDLKAENVMIDSHGGAKLLDFGLAHTLEEQGLSRLTAKDRILGTPEAMSPEQATGGTLDARSDLFSLGSLLYRTVTGASPFAADNPLHALQKVAFADFEDPRSLRSDLPEGLCRLLERLLQKDPAQRPQSAAQLEADLGELIRPGSSSASAPAMVHLPRRSAAGQMDTAAPGRRHESATLLEIPSTQDTVTTLGERRQITILQCEISRDAGSQEPQGALDPEEWIELKPRLDSLIASVLEAMDGSLGQTLDQGYLLYFGLPKAREDDARRAVYAARMLVEGAQGRLSGALSLRLGIHTGPVVVAPQTAGDSAGAKLAFGQTLAWVAGLTSLAKPGQILLSAATQTTVARFFRLHPMPPVAIPGLGPAVEAFRDGGDLENPEDMPHAAAPFVGREQQLLILLDHWQLAREGSGQAVLMSGEAGIGKSRLVREVETRASSGGLVLRCQCTPYERHTPFAPIVHLLGQLIGTEHDPSTPKESALRRFLDSYDLPQDEMMPLLASLLAISWDGESRPADLAPPVLRRQTLEALVTLLLEMAERSPLLLVVEDLHWIDPSSQELIDLLVQHGPSVPVLLLLTARPNFESPWNQRAHLVRMTLGRLGREHVENLIRSVAEDELPPGVLEAIVDRADGVPLFVEEITKVMTETRRRSGGGRGAGPRHSPPGSALPVSLQDFLMARLDPLGEAKVIAQHAAVLGRVFTLDELIAVTGAIQPQLEPPLRALVDAELLYRRGMGTALRFSFKHALIQDAAYQSLLKGPRRRIHASVARFLEKRMLAGERGGNPHERIAHHYSEAGLADRAIEFWRQAATSATGRSAHLEAAAHFESALEQLARTARTAERDAAELELQTLLASARVATQGFGAVGVEQAYARAYELCENDAADSPRLAWVLQGLWAFYETTADLPRSVRLGQRILRLADRTGDDSLRFEGLYALGNSRFFIAEFSESRRLLEAAIELDPPGRDSRREATGLDPRTSSLAFSAVVLWHDGSPAAALARSEQAVREAEEIDHPFSLAFSLYMAAWVHHLRREPEAVQSLAGRVVELSKRHGYFWLSLAEMLVGWARGSDAGDLKIISEGIEAYIGSDARLGLSYYLAVLAETALGVGETETASATLDRAFAYSRETGESFFLAELYRLRGEVARAKNRSADAAEAWLEGLEVARRQGARALELRLALALAEERRRAGHENPEGELIEACRDDFQEAHGTPEWERAQGFLAGA